MTRILIETGSHSLLNHGDVAMYQVAAHRLQQLLPSAEIQVLTDNPKRLLATTPFVTPVIAEYPRWWSPIKKLIDDIVPEQLLASTKTRLKSLAKSDANTAFNQRVYEALTEADIVIHTGMGGINDAFGDEAIRRLNFLGAAKQQGKLVSLFSQGIGPITESYLKKAARNVLPELDFIGIREDVFTPHTLAELGVADTQIHFTGDDAVALALTHGAANLGDALGINIRLAPYAQLSKRNLSIFQTLQDMLRPFEDTPKIVFSIAQHDAAATVETLKLDSAAPEKQFTSPIATIQRIGQCRLVVTGSYHGAVFALGQGIPAICLAGSNYYMHKFQGLAEQFPNACHVINLQDTSEPVQGSSDELVAFWQAADTLRPEILSKAEALADLSQQAYGRWVQLLA